MSITNNFEPYATGSDYPSCRSECEAQRLKEGEEDGEQQKVTILQTMFKNQHLGPPAHGISSSVNVSDIILDALRNDEAMNYNSEDEHQCEAMDTFDSNPRTSRCRSRSSDWVIGQDESSIFNSIFFEDITFKDSVSEYGLETSAISFCPGGFDEIDDECASLATSMSSVSTTHKSDNTPISFTTPSGSGQRRLIFPCQSAWKVDSKIGVDPISLQSKPAPFYAKDRKYITGVPTGLDILCGRGGSVNRNTGNVTYLVEVSERKLEYHCATKVRKNEISLEILSKIQKYGGRFLILEKNRYFIADDKRARKKISQALREGQRATRVTKRQGMIATKRQGMIATKIQGMRATKIQAKKPSDLGH